MNKRNLIILFLLSYIVQLYPATSDSLQVRVDSSKVEQRSFSDNFTDKYSGEEFDYNSAEGEAQNFIARAINWILRRLGEIFGIELGPGVYQVVEFIVYCAMGILVLYLIIRFLTGNAPATFFGRKSSVLTPLNIEDEHIEKVDLDKYIREALAQKDYRLAIRYMYLRTLRELSLYKIIDWHYDKTNSDYLREIENEHLRQEFKKVSYLYDYIWYGEFPIDDGSFNTAREDFERLNKSLTHVR